MANVELQNEFIDKIRKSLFSPEIDETFLNKPLSDFLKSSDHNDFYRLSMYHLLVANYLVTMVMNGKIASDDVDYYLGIGSTAEGLTKLAAWIQFNQKHCDELKPTDIDVIKTIYEVADESDPLRTIFVKH